MASNANDVIVIEYQANIKNLEANLNKVEDDLRAVEKIGEKAFDDIGKKADDAAKDVDILNKSIKNEITSINTLKKQLDVLTKTRDQSNDPKKIQIYNKHIKETSEQISKLQKNTGLLSDALGGLLDKLPFAGAIQEAKELGSNIKEVGISANNASKGMSIFRVATIAALGPIALIITAITTLIAFFKRTDDGATKLEGILGALSATFNEITGYLAELGSEFFNAFTSLENFQKGLSDLGEFISNQVTQRILGLINLFKAVGLAVTGDFDEAIKLATNAGGQLILGVDKISDKLSDFSDRIAKAAKEAYDFAVAMDAIADGQRELGVELSANRVQIIELIRQSKNHSLAIQDRIERLRQANKLDEQGLTKTLELEEAKLKLIQERNKRESDSINQRLNDEIKLAKTEKERIALEEKRLSINDDLAEEEANQQIRINNLKAESVALQERNNAAIAALIEQGIQEELQKEQLKSTKLENIQKERLLKQEINEEEFGKLSTQILINSLNNQKAILESHGKDTTEIEKAILDAQLKNREKEIKKSNDNILKILAESFAEENLLYKQHYEEQIEALNNQYLNGQINRLKFERETVALTEQIQKDSLKREVENLQFALSQIENDTNVSAEDRRKIEEQLLEAKRKLNQQEIDDRKKVEDEKKALAQKALDESINIAQQALQGLNDLQLARETQAIENERAANEARNAEQLKNLDIRKNAGLISEAEYNAQKAKLDQQAAQKESELKKRQFKAEQEANIDKINIDLAAAIVKTYAQFGFTPLAAIAIGGLILQATIQKALVRNQPVPQFKDGVIRLQGPGTETSDSIPAMLSKNESVIEAKQSIKHTSDLEAIQGDYFKKHVYENYIVPALKQHEAKKRMLQERQASTAENIMKSLELNGFGDLSHLERLTKSNKKVYVQNMDAMPKQFAKEISRVIVNKNDMV